MGAARPAARPVPAESASACRSCMIGGASRMAGVANMHHHMVRPPGDRGLSKVEGREKRNTKP